MGLCRIIQPAAPAQGCIVCLLWILFSQGSPPGEGDRCEPLLRERVARLNAGGGRWKQLRPAQHTAATHIAPESS